jgi:hypothetical protein
MGFIIPCLIILLSPIIAYELGKTGIGTIKLLIRTVLFFGAVYGLCRLLGIHWVGEEGDYLIISFSIAFYVILIFQSLRIRKKAIRNTFFISGLISLAPVFFLTVLVLTGYTISQVIVPLFR